MRKRPKHLTRPYRTGKYVCVMRLRHIVTILCVWAFLVGTASLAANSDLDRVRTIYENNLKKIQTEHRTKIATAPQQYLNALRAVNRRYQASGALEPLMLVKQERTRFEKEKAVPSPANPELPEDVQRIQRAYVKNLGVADTERMKTLVTLTDRYLTYLDRSMRALTKNGSFDQALAVKKEISAVKDDLRYQAASIALSELKKTDGSKTPDGPDNDPPADVVEPYALRWIKGQGLVGIDGTPIADDELSSSDGNSVNVHRYIRCGGGRTVLEKGSRDLIKAIDKSGELTVELTFATRTTMQPDQANIIGCSMDSKQRNITLFQQNGQVWLSLRTTQTGKNGKKIVLRLVDLRGGRRSHILLTYKKDNLGIYVDGKRDRSAKLSGKLSNWNNMHRLVLGNEYNSDLPWKGLIYQFEISNQFMDETTALKRFENDTPKAPLDEKTIRKWAETELRKHIKRQNRRRRQ